MNKFLDTYDKLEYVDYKEDCTSYVFSLDELNKEGFSIGEVYNLFESWIKTIQPDKAVSIIIYSDSKSKNDCLNLFGTFLSIFSKQITTDLKEGEKRLAPRSWIMNQTFADIITMKRFLNYQSKIRYLQIKLKRKGRSLAAL